MAGNNLIFDDEDELDVDGDEREPVEGDPVNDDEDEEDEEGQDEYENDGFIVDDVDGEEQDDGEDDSADSDEERQKKKKRKKRYPFVLTSRVSNFSIFSPKQVYEKSIPCLFLNFSFNQLKNLSQQLWNGGL